MGDTVGVEVEVCIRSCVFNNLKRTGASWITPEEKITKLLLFISRHRRTFPQWRESTWFPIGRQVRQRGSVEVTITLPRGVVGLLKIESLRGDLGLQAFSEGRCLGMLVEYTLARYNYLAERNPKRLRKVFGFLKPLT